MKVLAIVFLAHSAVYASSIPLNRRQVYSDAFPTTKPNKVENLPATIKKAGVTRSRIWFGPYTLKGANSTEELGNAGSLDPDGTAWNYMVDNTFPRDITILKASATVIFPDGSTAAEDKGVSNHHLLFQDFTKLVPPVMSCDGQPNSGGLFSEFAGGFEEKGESIYSSTDAKVDAGYYVGKDDQVFFNGDVVNHKKEKQTIFAVADIEYIKGKAPGHLEASVHLLTVGGCDGPETTHQAPAGQKKWSMKSATPMITTTDGYIVAARGHIHDGGVNVRLLVNGKVVCDSKAVYGKTKPDGSAIDHMTVCTDPIKVAKGDKLIVEANYDTEAHQPRRLAGTSMAEDMVLMSVSLAAK